MRAFCIPVPSAVASAFPRRTSVRRGNFLTPVSRFGLASSAGTLWSTGRLEKSLRSPAGFRSGITAGC